MSTNMGNLEKLGILVIVILVVVVGVVAITPKSAVDDRPYGGEEVAQVPQEPEELKPEGDGRTPADVWPLPPADPRNSADPALTPPANPPVGPGATPPAPPAAPTFRLVKVQKNDTLAGIAKRELGSSTRYQEILDANPGVSPTKLKIGSELKIPLGSSSSAAAVPPAPGVTPPAGPAPGPLAPSAERTYVVKSGDTLSSIAQSQLGSSKRWPEIAKASESVLHGSTKLSVGMTLTIPGGAETTTSSDPAPVAPASNAGAASGEREYVVKQGDSWWLIAKNEMGSEAFLGKLREANADVAKGDGLQVGTKIRIPAR